MTGDRADDLIRRAIGGDPDAIDSIVRAAASTDVAAVVVMAALLEDDSGRLDRARSLAATSRDRQTVEIARAHLDGRHDLVDALSRDHLVDHPSSLIVAWVAGHASARRTSDREERTDS